MGTREIESGNGGTRSHYGEVEVMETKITVEEFQKLQSSTA